MAWPTLVPPTAGTVITVAREVAMNNDPLNWLRLLTGNGDPPAANYVVVSAGTASSAWGKVTADVLGPGAAVGNIGYQPLSLGGGVVSGAVTIQYPLTLQRLDIAQPNAGRLYLGGSGVSYIEFDGSRYHFANRDAIIDGDLTVWKNPAGFPNRGQINLGGSGTAFLYFDGSDYYFGANRAWHSGNDGAGSGLDADLLDGQSSGFFQDRAHHTGTQTASTISDFAATVATLPAASAGTATSAVSATNAGNANTVGGRTPTATPTANAIPIADGSGTLDAWVTPTAAAPVPSGLIAFIADASLPAGWAFYTPANGRVLVAAGTASVTNPQSFAVGNNYGGDWAHAHIGNSFGVTTSVSVSVSGAATGGPEDNTGGPSAVNGLASAGGVNLPTDIHTHSLNGVSFAVSASGSGSGSGTATGNTVGAIWVPPSHALNAIRKS